MVNHPRPQAHTTPEFTSSALSIPILHGKSVKSCHITAPDLPKPMGAILYEGKYYSYFRYYDDVEAVQRAATRLIARGDRVLLTRVRKGLVLWVFEPEAQLAKSLQRR